MAADSILDADYSERRWVDQIRKNFNDNVGMDDTNVPVCVFSVPKSISHIRPEAYVPQAIALGPYHHFHPHLYQMERYKVASVKEFLHPDQVLSFESLVIDDLKEMEIMVRACYHKYLDLDGDSLAWIVAIDGLFLLDILSHYGDLACILMPKKFTNSAVLVRDIMVLENQIPLVILNEIRKSLRLSSTYDHDHDGDSEFFSMLKGFCEVHSPLKLASGLDYCVETSFLHLLDFMYHLIVGNHSTKEMPWPVSPPKEKVDDPPEIAKEDHVIENVEDIVEMGLSLGTGKKIDKPMKVIRSVPWEKISNLLGLKIGHKLHEQEDDHFHVEEIEIPTASSLYKYGGINFSHTMGGIRDVKFEESEATLYLPVITLDIYSEVVLRNLVAYEMATSKSKLELSQYVDLMSGIIDTEADVRLLKAKGVIEGNMTNTGIANLFNGMNKSNASTNATIEKINEYYNNRPAVKAWTFLKNRAHDFQQVLAIGLTVSVCLLMILYSFCEVYGCPSFFNKTK